MGNSEDPRLSELARYVRQRVELGAESWVLEEWTAADAARAVDVARAVRDTGEEAIAHDTGERHDAGEGPSRTSGSGASGGAPKAEARSAGSPTAEPASSPTGESPSPPAELPASYEKLREEALGCTRCRLCEGRKQVVFADGNSSARVMVVGEAPGANEDRTGLPFVGAAGKLLDLLLASVDLSREESVYICNVIKCRPPNNRNPRPDEIEACAPYLHRQIELVEPEVILAVGTFAGKLLSGHDRTLGRLRGEVHSYRGTPLVVTYHPAALLRNSGWTRPTWEDMQLLREILDGS